MRFWIVPILLKNAKLSERNCRETCNLIYEQGKHLKVLKDEAILPELGK